MKNLETNQKDCNENTKEKGKESSQKNEEEE